jgi:hypothetical protein
MALAEHAHLVARIVVTLKRLTFPELYGLRSMVRRPVAADRSTLCESSGAKALSAFCGSAARTLLRCHSCSLGVQVGGLSSRSRTACVKRVTAITG